MALNYATDPNHSDYQVPRAKQRRPQKQVEAKDLVIINREQFAKLWRKWDMNERRLHDAISGLVYELSERLEKASPATDASRDMFDLFFTDKEQIELWMVWEKEDDERYQQLKEENIKAAIGALKQLTSYQRSTVLAETDEIERGCIMARRGISDLLPRLKDEDAKEIYDLVAQKLGIS